MDVLDKFFKKFSYKFPKGYPDINDAQDILMLEGILGEMGIDLKETISRAASIKAAEDFANSSIGKEYDFIKFKSGKYENRLNSTKVKFPELQGLLATHFGVEDNEVIPHQAGKGLAASDSVPGYQINTPQYGEVFISFSGGKKGTGGKKEEAALLQNIKAATGEGINPITVKFIGKDKSIEVKKVIDAIDASQKTQEGAKADVQLLTPSGIGANLSLKQDSEIEEDKVSSGFRWASVNNDKTPFRKAFVNKALTDESFPVELRRSGERRDTDSTPKYLMFKRGTDTRISKVVVEDAPNDENELYVFGTDNPKTQVVGGTFNEDDFNFDDNNNTLTVKVNSIYTDISQIIDTPVEPVFTVEQHAKQPYGLDFRIVPAGKATIGPNTAGIRIKYSDVF